MKAIKDSPASEFLPMTGGEGESSYSQNSQYQRYAANTMKEKIDEEIAKTVDMIRLSSTSKTICIADLGCSTGPNTFIAVQNIMEAIKLKHHSQNPNTKPPKFQVFFNDRTTNDFNTLFRSIPQDSEYFAAGVPGSFSDQLFPESSLHLVYSAYAAHWISKVPEELLDKNSPSFNKGSVYYINAPEEVHKAYATQFHEDFGIFLKARAKEIVQGGIMILLLQGCPNGADSRFILPTTNLAFEYLGFTYMEMAKEGLLSEELVDSFNIPVYGASPDEMFSLIGENDDFSIERLELSMSALTVMETQAETMVMHIKAGLGGMLSHHFGSEVTMEMFERLQKNLEAHIDYIASISKKSGQLFIVLKRK